MLQTKKGQKHLDVILSFVIFILFVVFLLIFFNPIKEYSKSTTYLDMTEKKILEYVSTNLTVVSLTFVNPPASGNCFYITLSLPNKVIIKDENSAMTNANKNGDRIYFQTTTKRFYKIYSSNELNESSVGGAACQELAESNYTIGVTNFYKKVSYSKLIGLNGSYSSNYTQLKQALGLENDFNIAVKSDSGYLFKAEKFKPKATDIMAKDIPIQILNENASLIPAIMNIQTW